MLPAYKAGLARHMPVRDTYFILLFNLELKNHKKTCQPDGLIRNPGEERAVRFYRFMILSFSRGIKFPQEDHMNNPRYCHQALMGVAACALIIVFCSSCSDKPAPAPEVVRPVKMLKLGADRASLIKEFPGKVEALQDAQMAFEVAGKVIEFPVNEGQLVKEGEVLAKLDPRDFQSALDAKLARERTTKTDLERGTVLLKSGVIPQRDFDLIKRAAEEAKADADIGRKALDDTVLRAPFSGTVAKKIKQDFKNVQAKEPVLILHDDSLLKLSVNLPESDAVRAKTGLTLEERNARIKANVIVSSIPGRKFPAKIKEFATAADPTTRTYEVTFVFKSTPDVSIKSGMTAKIEMTIPDTASANGGIRIPAFAAVTDHSGKPFAWVVDLKTMAVQKREVVLGELSGDTVEVRGGLASGDTIAVSGMQQLSAGMKVSELKN
jgi:RND family efflux transporter MFP subunit